MIDNIVLLITGTLHQRPIAELIPKCHQLGSFEAMEAIHIASSPAELYNAVLVDTPLAPYFIDCISEQDLDELNIEIIRNTLYKVSAVYCILYVQCPFLHYFEFTGTWSDFLLFLKSIYDSGNGDLTSTN